MIFISAATVNTPYEEEIKNLITSLQLHRLTYFIYYYQSTGNWLKNGAQKPLFIWQALKQFRQPVCWLDADAIVHEYPVHLLNVQFVTAMTVGWREYRVLPGTIAFKFSDGALAFTRRWYEETIKLEEPNDQDCLQKILSRDRRSDMEISWEKLPIEYCKMFHRDPEVKPIIGHYQASRRHKHVVEGTA